MLHINQNKMEKPTNQKLTKEWQDYISHLEEKIKSYESKKTMVNSYFGLKKVVDDLNNIMIKGIQMPMSERVVPVISPDSLSSKDDKIIDRLFNFIKCLDDYNKQLQEMEKRILPQLKEEEEYGGDFEEMLLSEK